MDYKQHIPEDIVHLSRLALSGRKADILLYIKRLIRKTRDDLPEVSSQLAQLIAGVPQTSSPIREAKPVAIPVDQDSRLQLVRIEPPPAFLQEPVWTANLKRQLEQVVNERRQERELTEVGISPTKSLLFTGAPGVGKTLSARWLAYQLNRPLLILDLSAVMSSFLGRTGNNLRFVLDYAKQFPCVLLLDEFDAIAKRRDDVGELGELKRLVTVLLQEIDDYPASGVLVAATNHAELLDPAAWRRFDMILDFPLPTEEQIQDSITKYLLEFNDTIPADLTKLLSLVLADSSFSEIERVVLTAKRESILTKRDIQDCLLDLSIMKCDEMNKATKRRLVVELHNRDFSIRKICELTKISRVTIAKYLEERNDG